MKNILLSSAALAATIASAQAALILPDSVSLTAGSEFFSAQNLIATTDMALGGDGLTADDLFTSSASGANSWVTDANGADYFAAGTAPILDFGFSSPQNINGIAVWSYPNTGGAGNGVSDGTVEFFAGAVSLGIESLVVNLGVSAGTHQPALLNSYSTYNGVTRAVVTFTDNHFGGTEPGGDRAGAGTVAFDVVPVPEPSSSTLVALGIASLILRRKK